MYEETINGLKTIVNNYKGRLSPWMRVTIAKAADAIEEMDNLLNLYRQGRIRRPNNDGKLFPQPVSKTDEFGKAEQLGRRSKWNLDGSCPRCGKHSLQTYGNFCCYCGADMRGEDVPVSEVPLNRGLD